MKSKFKFIIVFFVLLFANSSISFAQSATLKKQSLQNQKAPGMEAVIFPMPAWNYVYFTNTSNVYKITIKGIMGNVIENLTGISIIKPTTKFDISNYYSGMYSVTFFYNDGDMKQQFFVKKRD